MAGPRDVTALETTAVEINMAPGITDELLKVHRLRLDGIEDIESQIHEVAEDAGDFPTQMHSKRMGK